MLSDRAGAAGGARGGSRRRHLGRALEGAALPWNLVEEDIGREGECAGSEGIMRRPVWLKQVSATVEGQTGGGQGPGPEALGLRAVRI